MYRTVILITKFSKNLVSLVACVESLRSFRFQSFMTDGNVEIIVSLSATGRVCRNWKRQKTVKMQTHNVKIQANSL